MKRLSLSIALLLVLAACGAAPASTAQQPAEPAATTEPVVTTEPAVTAEPTQTPPQETPVPAATAEPGMEPVYTITRCSSREALTANGMVAWPEEGVSLQADWVGSLEDAAAYYGVPLETLQTLNPDPDVHENRDGETVYYNLLLQAEPYILPDTPLKQVRIDLPGLVETNWFDASYEDIVPEALDDQAATAMTEAYNFLYHHEVAIGYYPSEVVEGIEPRINRTVEGARFTHHSVFSAYLQSIFTQDLAESYANGLYFDEGYGYYLGGFGEGEDDAIYFQDGDRGGNIAYCGTAYTEPELQPDGSLQFWQLALTCEDESFTGWAGPYPVVPDTANPTLVRLEPTAQGWRVAELHLPY